MYQFNTTKDRLTMDKIPMIIDDLFHFLYITERNYNLIRFSEDTELGDSEMFQDIAEDTYRGLTKEIKYAIQFTMVLLDDKKNVKPKQLVPYLSKVKELLIKIRNYYPGMQEEDMDIALYEDWYVSYSSGDLIE